MTLIAGIDGCGPDWVCVTMDTRDRSLSAHRLSVTDFLPLRWAMAGIDIPIGLPDAEGCLADRQARALLRSPRASSVFPRPIRPALQATSWEEMGSIVRSFTGRGVAKQSYAILRKVREINALVRSSEAAASCFFEVHPEVSFAAWGGHPMRFSKKRPEGRAERLELIVAAFGASAVSVVQESLGRSKVPFDDVADAFAALWSTERRLHGKAVSLPAEPVYDAQGLPIRIWY